MSPRTTATAVEKPAQPPDRADDVVRHLNEVRLVGRVSGAPEERTLPSGDVLWTLRLVVGRGPGVSGRTVSGATRSKQTVDTVDCAVWSARVRRSVSTWRDGDVVEVEGAIRRRFYRGANGVASRVEVEVTTGRMARRAGTS